MKSVTRLLAVVVAIALFAPLTALAQDKPLSSSIITASSALDSTSQRAVNTFVNDLIDQMVNGNQQQVMDARSALIDPFNSPNASNIFKTAYSAAMLKPLEKGVTSDRVFVRISSQMLVANLTDPAAISLVESGLQDNVSAVRYLAALAAGQIGARLTLPADSADPQFQVNNAAQNKLLGLLVGAMSKETDNIVVEQLLAAIGALTINNARDQLLAGLNDRVTVRAANPHLAVGAERATLARSFSKIVREVAGGQEPSTGLLKMLSVVGGRNMRLTAKLLDEGDIHEAIRAQHLEMLKLSNTILRWSAKQLKVAEDALPKDDIKDAIDQQRWPEIRLRAEEWVNLMTNPPYRFSEQVLNVDAR